MRPTRPSTAATDASTGAVWPARAAPTTYQAPAPGGLFFGSSHINGEPRGKRRLETGVGPLAPSAIRGATRTGRVLFIASNALTPVLCDEPFLLRRPSHRRQQFPVILGD